MSAPIWNPPAKVANDVASATIAGYTFAWAGMTGGPAGGILSLRVGLRGSTLVELARALARARRRARHLGAGNRQPRRLLPGSLSRVQDGAVGAGAGRGLRAGARVANARAGAGRALRALRAAGGPDARRRARRAATPRAPPRRRSPKTSTLRRAALQPGKTLARKKPLTRKTPLGRGGRGPSRSRAVRRSTALSATSGLGAPVTIDPELVRGARDADVEQVARLVVAAVAARRWRRA